jgi:hypothetical protein
MQQSPGICSVPFTLTRDVMAVRVPREIVDPRSNDILRSQLDIADFASALFSKLLRVDLPSPQFISSPGNPGRRA